MTEVPLSPNAVKVLKARYLKCDSQGHPTETPREMFHRVANNIAQANTAYGEDATSDARDFFRIMSQLLFLPNSPTLMNAGNELQQLSACFVLPIEDSMEGIFEAVKHAALIQKSGGGTGFSFSKLRPKSDIVQTTGGIASGPISFMKVFDSATDTIKQGGKRRGANMGILRVDHPDILDFISAKAEEDHLNNFNLSVAVTDAFMEAVKADAPYQIFNPRNQQVTGELMAREVFYRMVEMAHGNGEPGIIFIDAMNRDNPTPGLGNLEATNPCSEQPLLPYEACNLGSINLSRMLEEGGREIHYGKLEETTRIALRFLDNVIDMNQYPLPRIEEMARGNRKVGLGVMGWSDLLIRLGIPYNSLEAVNLAGEVMAFIQEISHDESHEIAKRRGSFPNIQKSSYQKEMRNATTTTIAPTGSISIIASCSSGIEPLFAINYERHVIDDVLIETHPLFEKLAQEEGFYSQDLMVEVARRNSIQTIEEIPMGIRRIFVTSHDIKPEWHIKMQAAFQQHIDNATSKTVNFPYTATQEEVAEVYMMAYDLGCKGVTVYRDGSRTEQVLQVKKQEDETGRKKRPRPEVTWGTTEKTNIGCGRLYITVNSDEGGICEVFTSTGRGGGCRSQSEATSRLISLALRSGIPIEEITHQLKGIRCAAAIKRKGVHNVSCPDAIARAIEKYLCHGQKVKEELKNFYEEEEPDYFKNNDVHISQACPDCGYELEHDGGCVFCRNCGYTKCW